MTDLYLRIPSEEAVEMAHKKAKENFTTDEHLYRNEIERDFFIYHEQNPSVYEFFNQFCFQYINSGKTKVSSAMIINRIRWEIALETDDADFKINDHYTPYYSRLWVKEHPDYKSFFNFRKVKELTEQERHRLLVNMSIDGSHKKSLYKHIERENEWALSR